MIETLAQYDQLTKLYIDDDASEAFIQHPTVYAVYWNEDLPGLASLDDVAAGPCVAAFSEIMNIANIQ